MDCLHRASDINVLCVAGGTGITFVLTVQQSLVHAPKGATTRMTELIWAIRKRSDLQWIQAELGDLISAAKPSKFRIRIFVTREDEVSHRDGAVSEPVEDEKADFVKVEETGSGAAPASKLGSSSSSSSDGIEKGTPLAVSSFSVHQASLNTSVRRPDLSTLVNDFVSSTVSGPTIVYASGPGGMVSDLRRILASCNSGGKVWKGEER